MNYSKNKHLKVWIKSHEKWLLRLYGLQSFESEIFFNFQQESGEKDRIEAVKQAERDKVSLEMDEWQNLDDDERERQYLKSIKTQNQFGMFISLPIRHGSYFP